MENSLKRSNRKIFSVVSQPEVDAPIPVPPRNLSPFQDLYIEHLKNQYDHLVVLYEYHVHHMNRAKNRQLFERHRELADTISRALAQYETLLISLQSK